MHDYLFRLAADDVRISQTDDPQNEGYVILHATLSAGAIVELQEDYRLVVHKDHGFMTPDFAKTLLVKALVNRFYGDFRRHKAVDRFCDDLVEQIIQGESKGKAQGKGKGDTDGATELD